MQFHSKLSEINVEQWKSLSSESNTASFFQSFECYKFYSSLSFLKPFIFGISINNHLSALVSGYVIAEGGLIKRFFSKRAIIPGGVMIGNKVPESTLTFFLSKVVELLDKNLIYLDIRNYNDYSNFKTTFIKAGFLYNPHLNFKIHIQNREDVIKRLSKSKRRQIILAQNQGVYWERSIEKSDLEDFYSILSHTYKVKIKKPLYPFEFFEKLIESKTGFLLIVKKANVVIGGMICVALSQNTLYEWFISGNDEQYKYLYPSVMATWAGIDFAIQHNIKNFDFMGAGSPDTEYGVRTFKSKFGGDLHENGRFLYINKPFRYKLGKFIISLIKPK